MLREASDEIAAEQEADVKLPEGSSRAGDLCSCPSAPEAEEDAGRTDNSCAEDRGPEPPAGPCALVRTRGLCGHRTGRLWPRC